MNIHEWLGEDIPPEIIQQSVEWIATLDDLDAKPDAEKKRADFYVWLGQNPLHQQAFAELSEIWAKTACLESLKSKIDASQVISFPGMGNNKDQGSHWPNHPLLADPMMCSNTFAPSWLYGVTLVTIVLGLFLPVIF